MTTNNETTEVEPQAEPQDSPHTAELKGDNIEVEDDYSQFIALEEDPLLVTLNGVNIESLKDQEWHYAWVRNGKDGRASQINMRQMQGFELVKGDDEVVVPAQDEKARKKSNKVVINELTLMKCPMKLQRQREEYFRQENEKRMAGMKRELNREVDGDAYGEIDVRHGGYT